jgi:hypothetical protein
MRASSKKAKGRRLQQEVAQKISEAIGLPCGQDQPIESRGMSQNGVDIRLDSEARKRFPYSVECKNQETWSLPAWIKQAQENQMDGTDWMVVCSKNRTRAVVVLDIDVFFELFKKSFQS